MKCSLPPPLSDDELSAAIDLMADAATRHHLARCAGCAARLEQARQVDQALTRQLWRADCPSPQQLGDYHLGLMEPTAERPIIRHLEQCALCRTEIADLRLFLEGTNPAVAPTATAPDRPARPRLGELAARLLPRAPALALRGSQIGPFTAEADGVTVFLDVQAAADGQIMVNGQVIAKDQERWIGALAELRQAGGVQAVATLDDLGGFRCGPLAPGPTDVRITPEQGPAVTVPTITLTP